jgi:chitin disaccharide deacetylase
MTAARRLIVNGDDFGQSAGTTAGVAAAHEHGVLTSASLMVRWPAARAAAAYAAAHSSLGVGLHVDLGEWVYRDGEWMPLYEVVSLDDEQSINVETAKQLRMFRDLLGRGPTHIDSHQHVHRFEPVRSVLLVFARRLNIPLRECTPGIGYCGNFYGQTEKGAPSPGAITVDAFVRIVTALPPGVTELACHPASIDDVGGMYRGERRQELQTLCDPRVRATLRDSRIELRTFSDLWTECA